MLHPKGATSISHDTSCITKKKRKFKWWVRNKGDMKQGLKGFYDVFIQGVRNSV